MLLQWAKERRVKGGIRCLERSVYQSKQPYSTSAVSLPGLNLRVKDKSAEFRSRTIIRVKDELSIDIVFWLGTPWGMEHELQLHGIGTRATPRHKTGRAGAGSSMVFHD